MWSIFNFLILLVVLESYHNNYFRLISSLATETCRMFTNAYESLSTLDVKIFGHWRSYFGLKAKFYSAYAYNYQGEALLAEDKCGDAIRSLQVKTKFKYKGIFPRSEFR